jgi:hypothetical protein
MNFLFQELANFLLFLKAIVEVSFYMGLPVFAIVAAYEHITKRRI